MQETLPDNIKLVEVYIFEPNSTLNDVYDVEPLKMFVARRHEQELGLCLFNEQARIPANLGKSANNQPEERGRIANSWS